MGLDRTGGGVTEGLGGGRAAAEGGLKGCNAAEEGGDNGVGLGSFFAVVFLEVMR